jgi:futalosine hydrolase
VPDVLLVAATERELHGREGLISGIGPVEAASATARALALREFDAVLHVGVAGGRGLAPGSLVIGSEAVYCDLAAAITLFDRLVVDSRLVEIARGALPDAQVLPIGTSAAVGSVGADVRVEAMEGFGVLRAASLAGVPALEVRAISNEIGEPDRALWQIAEAIEVVAGVTPLLLRRIAEAVN